MSNLSDKFTVIITVDSLNLSNYFDVIGSLAAANTVPERVITLFNPWDRVYDPIMDTVEGRSPETLRLKKKVPINSLRRLALESVETPYVIMLEDDVVLRDEDFLDKVHAEHEHFMDLVILSEKLSAYSISIESALELTDPGLLGHGFEDLDFWLSFRRNGGSFVRIDPFLFNHKRVECSTRLSSDNLCINATYLERKHGIKFGSDLQSELYSLRLFK